MNCPSNISFSDTLYTSNIGPKLDNEDYLSDRPTRFTYRVYKMSICNVASAEEESEFSITAQLVTNEKNKKEVQRIRLSTSTVNTYVLSLEFYKDTNSYSLSGRNTSGTRELARKHFLAGLSCSDYSSSIETARRDTLYAFSNYVTHDLLTPNIELEQLNLPLVNTWLLKLLG